jgi:hypothetical protein
MQHAQPVLSGVMRVQTTSFFCQDVVITTPLYAGSASYSSDFFNEDCQSVSDVCLWTKLPEDIRETLTMTRNSRLKFNGNWQPNP